MGFADNWKSLIAQQAITTGRPVTPRQAQALWQSELAQRYANANTREQSALNRQRFESGREYQQGTLGLRRDELALDRERMAQGQSLAGARLDLSRSQFDSNRALQEAQFSAQQALQNQRLQMQRDQQESAALGSTIRGAIQLPLAGLMGAATYKQSGLGAALSSYFDSVLDYF